MQPPAYVQVTTFAVSGRLNATNYNQLTDGATESNDTASGALEYHVNSSVETSVAPPTSLSAASVTAASANATHGRVSSASAVTVPAIVRRSHFRFPYRVANAQRQNNFSFFLTGDVQYGAHRSEEWGAATASTWLPDWMRTPTAGAANEAATLSEKDRTAQRRAAPGRRAIRLWHQQHSVARASTARATHPLSRLPETLHPPDLAAGEASARR